MAKCLQTVASCLFTDSKNSSVDNTLPPLPLKANYGSSQTELLCSLNSSSCCTAYLWDGHGPRQHQTQQRQAQNPGQRT